MRLNHERTDLDLVSAEVRRRIVWSFKVMESYFSIGLPESELIPVETIYLELPSHEGDFDNTLHPTPDPRSPVLQKAGENRALHFCVKLATIRRDIMKLTRSLALYDQPFQPLAKLMQSLDRELSHIGGQMSLAAKAYNDASVVASMLDRLTSLTTAPQYPDAAPLVALHGLDASYVRSAEHVCLHHALAIVETLSDLNRQCTFPYRLEFDSAICGYHAIRLLLFISRSGTSLERPSPEFAASRAELCLAAIERFYRPSALVKPILDDMERMIQTFSPHSDSPSEVPSPELDTDRDPALRLTGPARARQGLEIHSLLRRSSFFDDRYAEVSTPPRSTDSASADRRQSIAQQISDLSSKVLTNGHNRAPNPDQQTALTSTDPLVYEQSQPETHHPNEATTATSIPLLGANLQPDLYPWIERKDWSNRTPS